MCWRQCCRCPMCRRSTSACQLQKQDHEVFVKTPADGRLECRQHLYSSLGSKAGSVAVEQYTSIAELEALVAVFGLQGACLLAASLAEPLKVIHLTPIYMWHESWAPETLVLSMTITALQISQPADHHPSLTSFWSETGTACRCNQAPCGGA